MMLFGLLKHSVQKVVHENYWCFLITIVLLMLPLSHWCCDCLTDVIPFSIQMLRFVLHEHQHHRFDLTFGKFGIFSCFSLFMNFFMTNSWTNTILSYTFQGGQEIHEIKNVWVYRFNMLFVTSGFGPWS